MRGVQVIGLITVLALAMARNSSADDRAPGQLDEIIVTAQKKSEKSIDVPTSLTVISGQTLETRQANSLNDITSLVPGLYLENGGGVTGQGTLVMRGLSTSYSTAFTGNLVSVYVDDTPVSGSTAGSRSGQFIFDMLPYDVERIEALQGPQGTLYGAGSMGGLVKYVLRAPDLTTFSAKVGGNLEYTDGAHGVGWGPRAAVNLPLIQNVLAVRLSGFDQYSAGYVDNVGLGIKDSNQSAQSGGRASILWVPLDILHIQASAMMQNINADGPTGVAINGNTRRPQYGDYKISSEVATPFHQKYVYYSLTGDLNLGFADLRSATSLQHGRNSAVEDTTPLFGGFLPAGSVVPFDLTSDLVKFTQEVRLTSAQDQRLRWMVGGFYNNENSAGYQVITAYTRAGQILPPPFDPFYDTGAASNYHEAAAFGNLTYNLTSQWDVTGGARFAEERENFTGTAAGFLNGGTIANSHGQLDANVTTWLGTTTYHLTPDRVVYLRAASGYRPGAPNSALPNVPPGSKPDKLINYEVGFKQEFWDHRAHVEVAAYRINWKDIQGELPNSQGLVYVANGGTASSTGLELSSSFKITNGLRLGETLAFTNAHLTEDAPALNGLNGNQLPLAARWSGSLTADYAHELTTQTSFIAGGSYRYTDAVYTQFASSQFPYPLPPTNMLDLYGGTTLNNTTLRMYVKNATNNRSYYGVLYLLVPTAPAFVPVTPRTVGLSVDYSF